MPNAPRALRLSLHVLLAACASGRPKPDASPDAAVAAPSPGGERETPPKMIRGPSPDIRGSIDVTFQVLVDATGRPDMSTLRLDGRGAGQYRAELTRWIESSRFEPARRGDRPVAAVYRSRIAIRVSAM